ncbi:MAG: hypothetical protein ACYSWU_18740 [Planctomycetota bacterium]|jgi:hypothetical protein
MEAPEIKVGEVKAGTAPFQYSLRTMFIVMTVLAVALSGIFAGPEWFSVLTGMFLGLTAPMVLTVALIYGRGYVRTFCIGALFPASLGLLAIIPGLSYPFYGMRGPGPSGSETGLYVGIFVLVAGIVIIVLGLVAMGVRWMVEAPHQRPQAGSRGETSQTAGVKGSVASQP